MGLLPDIKITINNYGTSQEVLDKLNLIMPTLQELSAKVDELQQTLDTEQDQMRAKIKELEDLNTELQQQVTDGGTAEERQALADKLTAVIDDIKSTIPDAEPEA